jgi:hypothetical protein
MLRWAATLVWCFAILLILDAEISWFSTCYEMAYHGGHHQNPTEYCSIDQGPFLRFLVWLEGIFESHRDAVIAAFTVVLAISTMGLWHATYGLWEASKEAAAQQSRDMQASIAGANRAAEAAKQAAEAARDSADTEEDALIATARPRIIVRRVEAIFLMPPNRPVSAQFRITNVGGSRAILVERNAILVAVPEEWTEFPQYPPASAINDERVLESGDGLTADANITHPLTDPSGKDIQSGALILFLYGFVRYRDDAGVIREMGFGRRFNPKTNRFHPLNDPEVEYGD